MPACGPRRGSTDGLVCPRFSDNNSRPSQGAKPREADDTKTSTRRGLPRLAPEERRFLCRRPPREVKVTQAMTTKSRRALAGIVQHVSSLVLKRQAHARSPEESAKGFHFHGPRPRPLGRQDRGHRRAHHDVTTRSFAGEDHLSSAYDVLVVSLCIWPLWDPFPPSFWGKRTKATISIA